MHKTYNLIFSIVATLGIATSALSMQDALVNYCPEVQQLIANTNAFIVQTKLGKYPVPLNSIPGFLKHCAIQQDQTEQIKSQAFVVDSCKKTRLVAKDEVLQACYDTFEYKKIKGTMVEQEFYKNMSFPAFITRLFIKRPLVFYGAHDHCLFLNDTQLRENKISNFQSIGTDQEDSGSLFCLENSLSYDEMFLAAHFGVSSPTKFFNNGGICNGGKLGKQGSYQTEGIITALVGPRPEVPGYMGWKTMCITKAQNTEDNGYGSNALTQENHLQIFSHLYGQLPTYDEVNDAVNTEKTTHNDYLQTSQTLVPRNELPHATKTALNNGYFNVKAYKKQIQLIAEPFLHDANERGKEFNQKIYVRVLGLGLGQWKILEHQEQLYVDTFKQILTDNTFEHINNVEFIYFNVKDKNSSQINDININFATSNVADKLDDVHAGKLLVTMYPWDSGSFPGNEYWNNQLSASMDPTIVCACLAASLQNTRINHFFLNNIVDRCVNFLIKIKKINANESKEIKIQEQLAAYETAGIKIIPTEKDPETFDPILAEQLKKQILQQQTNREIEYAKNLAQQKEEREQQKIAQEKKDAEEKAKLAAQEEKQQNAYAENNRAMQTKLADEFNNVLERVCGNGQGQETEVADAELVAKQQQAELENAQRQETNKKAQIELEQALQQQLEAKNKAEQEKADKVLADKEATEKAKREEQEKEATDKKAAELEAAKTPKTPSSWFSLKKVVTNHPVLSVVTFTGLASILAYYFATPDQKATAANWLHNNFPGTMQRLNYLNFMSHN